MVALTTFDCFDTVITRAVGGPRSIAYVVASRLVAQGVVTVRPEVFVRARQQAEKMAARRFGEAHTLADITVQLADLLGLEPSAAVLLEQAELEVERELSRPVPGGVRAVEAVRAAGGAVGFLSDTPLGHDVVQGLLAAQGVWRDGDRLWVSNELRASKDRGRAYAEVARRLGTQPASWRHVGDDARADVRMARIAGVAPTRVTRARLNRYESMLDGAAAATDGFSALLAGASRRSRLRLEVERPDLEPDRVQVAAGVAAPLLVGYVLWCLRRARSHGVRRLYFVARDGEILLDVARRLVDALGLDLDLRYLQGSRRAWLLPSMGRVDAPLLAAVVGREEKVTVRNCLGWVDLRPEQVADTLAEHGFPGPDHDMRLDPPAVARLVATIAGPGMAELVEERRLERATSTRDYLRQEGLLDGEPFALVDIGWQGTVGRMVTRMLAQDGGGPPALECYVGVTVPVHDAPGRTLRGYMYDDWRGTGFSTYGHDIYIPLEMWTAALQGRVEGYRHVDGRVVPVLGGASTGATEWIRDLRAVVDAFCDELVPVLPLLDPWADVRAVTWEALQTFWRHPTPGEVHAWGGYPFENDVSRYPIAGHLPPSEIGRSLLAGRPRLRAKGTWPAGVWRRTPRAVQVLRRGALTALGVGGKVRRARALAAGRVTAVR